MFSFFTHAFDPAPKFTEPARLLLGSRLSYFFNALRLMLDTDKTGRWGRQSEQQWFKMEVRPEGAT